MSKRQLTGEQRGQNELESMDLGWFVAIPQSTGKAGWSFFSRWGWAGAWDTQEGHVCVVWLLGKGTSSLARVTGEGLADCCTV